MAPLINERLAEEKGSGGLAQGEHIHATRDPRRVRGYFFYAHGELHFRPPLP